jgi:hypothetical protein
MGMGFSKRVLSLFELQKWGTGGIYAFLYSFKQAKGKWKQAKFTLKLYARWLQTAFEKKQQHK